MEHINYLNSEATISEEGAYVSSLILDGIPILQGSLDGYKTHGGLSVLIPYADIVYESKYTFDGVEYSLPKNATYENDFKNSIHGLTNDIKWKIRKRGEGYLNLACSVENPGYPSRLGVTVTYRLRHHSFDVGISLRNTGEKACPVMAGSHPYFISDGKWRIEFSDPLVSLIGITDKKVQSDVPNLSAITSYDVIDSSTKIFDDSFFGGGRLILRTDTSSVELKRKNMPFFSVYNGSFAPENSFSIIPLTAAPNAFNNKFGLKVLYPKKTFKCSFSMRLIRKQRG